VPWCVTDPADPTVQEVIVGAGAPIQTWCTYSPKGDGPPWNPQRGAWLTHQAGSTVLWVAHGHIYRVADGQRTPLGPGYLAGFSHDGRLLVAQDGVVAQNGACRGMTFTVYEIATGAPVATTTLDLAGRCAYPGGIDDLGRVYVVVDYQVLATEVRVGEILMWDTRTGTWARVDGVPDAVGDPAITYVTGDGFAVSSQAKDIDGYPAAVASIEGVVDAEGRFLARREVPVGVGAEWSPDRSLVVQTRYLDDRTEVVVLADADPSTQVALDLPGAADPPHFLTSFHWTSPTTIVLQNHSDLAYQCDARSGACTPLLIPGAMAADHVMGG
jgi:hypothetical protein